MYRNYEEYMQNVLGYNNSNNNTYRETDYYDMMKVNSNMQEVNSLYPEIYGIVYPVVQKVCSRQNMYNITKEQVDQMVDEIYAVIEPEEELEETRETLKNGDVRNPRVKDNRRPRQSNRLLRDLIRILIIRELLSGRPGGFGGFGGPGGIQGFPNPGQGGRPPIMRPRKYENFLKSKKQDINLYILICGG